MATIRDVAKLSGVSPATVSHVLHGRTERVSSDTRERVMSAVRALKYRPPALEDRQKAIRTNNIGFVASDLTLSPLSDYFFTQVLDGALEVCAVNGFSLTIFIEQIWGKLGDHIRRNYDGRCDGVILLAPSAQYELVDHFTERGTPVVLVSNDLRKRGVSSVGAEDETMGRTAAEHLTRLGHQRFAYVTGDPMQEGSRRRCAGFMSYLAAHGVHERDRIVVEGFSEWNIPRSGFIKELVDCPPEHRYTGVFCWNDQLAAKVIGTMLEHGCRVPQDFSVIGVDDAPCARETSPAITTFRQPLQAIGRRASSVLIDRISNQDMPDEHVQFAAELIVRESTTDVGKLVSSVPHNDFKP